MARVTKAPKAITTESVVINKTESDLPVSGMVNILFKGKTKNVSAQLAATLIKKGVATLK